MSLPVFLCLATTWTASPPPAHQALSPALPVPAHAHGSPVPTLQALPADTIESIYLAGVDFPTFLEGVRSRERMWQTLWRDAGVEGDLLTRAAAAGRGWRILAVAEDSCSDSVNSIPYIARLVEQLEGVEMRVVSSAPGRPVMERYRSPDGRPSTPTVVVLDPAGEVVGCWVEQPASLQSWWLAPSDGSSSRDRLARKMAWYEEDGGRETLREIVEMLEGAAAGRPVCRGGGG